MLIEINDLNTFYGLSHALNNVSLNIKKGEIVALLGRNGMGKSTLLKSIMGLIKPKSGKIVFNQKNICGQSPHKIAAAGIGYVPEERRIFPTLSVLDNLKMGIKGGRINFSSPEAWTFEKIFHYFPFMRDRTHQKGGHLSGGEQQMLTIGRALMGNPGLLLVDEPTEGLSPAMVDTVRDILLDVRKSGVSILLVEHNFKMAMSVADRVYLMGKAHIGYSGTVEELANDPKTRTRFLEV
ncbi:MAG: ABC transporter ATP-binding protein [Proteobacteria bacterium]|nr:ABC transporter ATP-binding protein [Pseudomonadota bacterium]MBU1388261.1 ABC transporter ATP-binding protein [Pseudomonadota bacterium]MBU1541850.1 ABC transporter ATP-binding protein [Pseudomonadota bacterium]MBU2481739.1 ABC transporter ATP-binding protein [Pseudomonadota bacterium]